MKKKKGRAMWFVNGCHADAKMDTKSKENKNESEPLMNYGTRRGLVFLPV